jgi:transcriptional regulator with GAF, ATPase, and Fis domain
MDDSTAQSALLTTLSHLTTRLELATTPADLLAVMADSARGLLPFTACALALPEPWRVWRTTSARPNEIVCHEKIPTAAAQTLERFVEHGRFLQIDDLLVPPWSQSSHRDVLWVDGTRSAMLVPLITGGVTIGAFSFTSIHANRYSIASRDSVTFLAWMMAVSVRGLPFDTRVNQVSEDKS